MTRATSLRKIVLVLGETLLLGMFAFAVCGWDEALALWTKGDGLGDLPAGTLLLSALLVVAVVQLVHWLHDLYDWRVTSNRNLTSVGLLQSTFYGAVTLALVISLLDRASIWFERELDRYCASPWEVVVCLVGFFPLSYLFRRVFHWIFSRGQWRERVLLVGNGSMAYQLEAELSHLQDPGYEIVGYVGNPLDRAPGLQAVHLGPMDRVCDVAKENRTHRVCVTLGERRGRMPTIELLDCRLNGIKVEEGEQLYERLTGKIAVQRLRPSYLIFSEGFQHSKTAFAFKRLMDLAMAAIGLLLLLPLCLVVAVWIKLDSRGPVFYGQTRVGREGRVFTAYKFRTMRADAEKGGPQWAKKDDDRITRIGNFLRKTRIDEVPQMWNVLRSEMSFVGPRPERPFFVEELRKQIPYYMERLLVKPGITGWAQVNHQYGNTVADAVTKLQYDLYYIKHLSIYLDLVTLFSTVKVVILRRGAV